MNSGGVPFAQTKNESKHPDRKPPTPYCKPKIPKTVIFRLRDFSLSG
jgi:hypothetical protein